MRISVVIPVRNRPRLVAQCVAGVLACEYPRERFEVIVVDNGSTDDTAAVAERAGARVIHEPVANRCRARNRGAEAARGEWVAFLDSDCVPVAGWLAALDRKLTEVEAGGEAGARVGIVAGPVRDKPELLPVEAYVALRGWFDQKKYMTLEDGVMRPFAITANLTARRGMFLELGGLDEALQRAGEDADFCWRAADAGWQMTYAPDAEVTHYHRSSVRGMARQSWEWGMGHADLFAKWQGTWGRCCWVEGRYWVWAVKGLIKAPWCGLTGTTRLEKRMGWYDFLSNGAMAAGRLWGGLRRGKIVF